jgi:hypothetical protein
MVAAVFAIVCVSFSSPQGAAFLAFAFNLVDQGQLLGRPLDTHRLRQLPAPAKRLQVRVLLAQPCPAPSFIPAPECACQVLCRSRPLQHLHATRTSCAWRAVEGWRL